METSVNTKKASILEALNYYSTYCISEIMAYIPSNVYKEGLHSKTQLLVQ